MARAKAHRPRGEKKKKEEKVLPTVLDVTVNLPDSTSVLLKGISTDRILDVRRLLAVHVETAHLTNYSLSHEIRGPLLKETLEITSLKPCVLDLIEEEYTEETVLSHVRRFLEIVSCTSCFGPSEKLLAGEDRQASDFDNDSKTSTVKVKPEPAEAMAAAAAATAKRDMTGMCPTDSKLGLFYEFLSASHLLPPVQTVKRRNDAAGSILSLDIKLCNGKTVVVTAGVNGFTGGRQMVTNHSLVGLLCVISQGFCKAYKELQSFFLNRNKFGNTPFGFRSNTWLVPPPASADPTHFPQLPTENPTWGGSGGGHHLTQADKTLDWLTNFQAVSKMPCSTWEERAIRDRKAFLLHSGFVDTAIRKAASVIESCQAESRKGLGSDLVRIEAGVETKAQVAFEASHNLAVEVFRESADATREGGAKLEGEDVDPERTLLKGLVANESTAVQDIATLGTLVLHQGGYTARVKVNSLESSPEDVEDLSTVHQIDSLFRQKDGGANALNANSLRILLHSSTSEQNGSQSESVPLAAADIAGPAENSENSAYLKVLDISLTSLQSKEEEEEADSSVPAGNNLIRWELGACWVQHLQNPPLVAGGEKAGQGKEGGGEKKAGKKSEQEKSKNEMEEDKDSEDLSDVHPDLLVALSGSQLKQLKGTKTGLHRKSMSELMSDAKIYYSEVALPKLVADFGSLELSPVDGRTLTDFMHTRGLRMRSLGKVAEQAKSLPHIRSLCIHEMVARAYKHLLKSAISATQIPSLLPAVISCGLNAMLGEVASQGDELKHRTWQWAQKFVKHRFEWTLSGDDELRKPALLRSLCLKVGIEMAPRTYDFSASSPFQPIDIISLIPIYKHVACSTADGRQLLESSKAALDKGKLDEAVSCGTKALARLVTVCGPYHRLTAGAYSLLAVVLYHTGDFNQATIYQQKALDINERELGLDHPDTMKSYGDLAVFYYRLQHTQLALKYVKRALYLLHLTCGPSHPNTAATYINLAMMEEGLGNVHLALRYLHEALQCNQRLLGPDHIQTAASYHAIAIALSLMEAYSLSKQHEQTTLQILQDKLGNDDLRTQDAAAWLEYFDNKAAEQAEAQRTGAPKPDASIASKGHLSVSDLLEFIEEDSNGPKTETSKKKPLKVNQNSSSIKATKVQSQPAQLGPVSSSSSSMSGGYWSDDAASSTSAFSQDDVLAAAAANGELSAKQSEAEKPSVAERGSSSAAALVAEPEALQLQKEATQLFNIREDVEELEGWKSAGSRGRGGNAQNGGAGAPLDHRNQDGGHSFRSKIVYKRGKNSNSTAAAAAAAGNGGLKSDRKQSANGKQQLVVMVDKGVAAAMAGMLAGKLESQVQNGVGKIALKSSHGGEGLAEVVHNAWHRKTPLLKGGEQKVESIKDEESESSAKGPGPVSGEAAKQEQEVKVTESGAAAVVPGVQKQQSSQKSISQKKAENLPAAGQVKQVADVPPDVKAEKVDAESQAAVLRSGVSWKDVALARPGTLPAVQAAETGAGRQEYSHGSRETSRVEDGSSKTETVTAVAAEVPGHENGSEAVEDETSKEMETVSGSSQSESATSTDSADSSSSFKLSAAAPPFTPTGLLDSSETPNPPPPLSLSAFPLPPHFSYHPAFPPVHGFIPPHLRSSFPPHPIPGCHMPKLYADTVPQFLPGPPPQGAAPTNPSILPPLLGPPPQGLPALGVPVPQGTAVQLPLPLPVMNPMAQEFVPKQGFNPMANSFIPLSQWPPLQPSQHAVADVEEGETGNNEVDSPGEVEREAVDESRIGCADGWEMSHSSPAVVASS